jgi:hypothetical protein
MTITILSALKTRRAGFVTFEDGGFNHWQRAERVPSLQKKSAYSFFAIWGVLAGKRSACVEYNEEKQATLPEVASFCASDIKILQGED